MGPTATRDRIGEQLQCIQVLHQGHKPEDVLQKYLEQQQFSFQQTTADTMSKLQDRQVYVLKKGKEFAHEIDLLDVFKPARSQIENLSQTLEHLQQNQEELKQELFVEQQRLENMQLKKTALEQSLKGIQEALRSSEAKGSPLEDFLHVGGKCLSAYISSQAGGGKK